MVRNVDFRRTVPPAELEGLVAFLWSVSWERPADTVHRQDVMPHPAVNISVGNPPPPGLSSPTAAHALRAVVNGVTTGLTTRMLSSTGWNLAIRTTVGGFGAWVDDVGALNNMVVPAAEVLALDPGALVREVSEAGLEDGRKVLAEALLDALDGRPHHRIESAREVARVAAAAEQDRTVVRVAELAEMAGVSVRTLQRTFLRFAGVSPTWVIRRYRLLDAAEAARDGQDVDWAELAAHLGYSDQAHLTRDFASNIGQTPAAYLAAQRKQSG